MRPTLAFAMPPVCHRNWSLLIEVTDGYLFAFSPFTFKIIKTKQNKNLLDLEDKGNSLLFNLYQGCQIWLYSICPAEKCLAEWT